MNNHHRSTARPLERLAGGILGAPKAKLEQNYILKMFVNELGVLEIVYLGLLFAFLANLEAEMRFVAFESSRRGAFGAPRKLN